MIFIYALASLVLDQLTKYFASNWAGLEAAICRFSEPTYNTAGAFSIQIPNAILAGFTAFLLTFIVVWVRKNSAQISSTQKFALGIILGGGLGNFLDRIFYEGVVDFISCSFWPTFNLADVFITVGVVILLISSFLKAKTK